MSQFETGSPTVSLSQRQSQLTSQDTRVKHITTSSGFVQTGLFVRLSPSKCQGCKMFCGCQSKVSVLIPLHSALKSKGLMSISTAGFPAAWKPCLNFLSASFSEKCVMIHE